MSAVVPPAIEPILVEEMSPSLDAWAVCRRLSGLPRLLFLDSAMPNAEIGRYSFITADPFEWVVSHRGTTEIESAQSPRRMKLTANPFNILSERLRRYPTVKLRDLPPFQGGLAGLFGYDLCHHVERLPRPRFDEFGAPDLAVGLYDWVLAFDHETHRNWFISTGLPETTLTKRRRRAEWRHAHVSRWMSQNTADVSKHATRPIEIQAPQWSVPNLAPLTSNFSRDEYLATIRRAVEYVHAGDCFQVNVAQRLLHPLSAPPLEIYERLRQRNPAPFGGYFDLGDFALLSASPERFLRVENGLVETRPIKGTRPRGATPDQDDAQRHALEHSSKDRAENVMIVDLLRNDLGRVCQFGSVRVEAVCQLETYQYVHHLVSRVHGRLRPEFDEIDLIRAAFPGGSITGAPKVRAMEIIAELEPSARGPYCGCLGYIGFDGTMDTNLLIRTMVAGKGWLQACVGGGIVAESDPLQEYQETWDKAQGLLQAFRA